jgi:hypothetical protein
LGTTPLGGDEANKPTPAAARSDAEQPTNYAAQTLPRIQVEAYESPPLRGGKSDLVLPSIGGRKSSPPSGTSEQLGIAGETNTALSPPPGDLGIAEETNSAGSVTPVKSRGPSTLNAEPGRYEVQGSDAGLAAQRRLDADPGVYELNGSANLGPITLASTAVLGDQGWLATGAAEGRGTARGVGDRIVALGQPHVEIIARIEQQERALKELTAEVARLRARQDVQERDRFGPDGNGPPDEVNIDEAVADIEFGVASLRLLRASLGEELPQLGAELQSLLLKWAYEGVKRACLAVVKIGKWLLGKADKFACLRAAVAHTWDHRQPALRCDAHFNSAKSPSRALGFARMARAKGTTADC